MLPHGNTLIKGYTQDDLDIIVVAKLSPTDMVVIITVYRLDGGSNEQ